MKIFVVGNGLVGNVIAKDLNENQDITVLDLNIANKAEGIKYQKYNVLVDELDILKKADIIVLAVPGSIAFSALQRIIPLGIKIVDISFFPESALLLNDLAIKHNTQLIVDCGVAPGLCNMFLGHQSTHSDIEEYICYVGGLPFERTLPWQYKAPFSPSDVLEEYTRPVYIRENGTNKTVEAMSGIEEINIDSVGTLEAFYTDGLRSLLTSFPNVATLKEKTLRYPGYIDKIKFLKETGFLSTDEIEIKGTKISPFELTSKLLIDQWQLKDDMEFTAMKVIISSKDQRVTHNLFDNKDVISGFSSMARTTGFTANAAVELFANNMIKETGVILPEDIGKNADNFKFVIDYLEERNIFIEITQENI